MYPLLAAAAGILSVGLFPHLDFSFLLPFAAGLLCWLFFWRLRWLLPPVTWFTAFCLGMAWAVFSGQQMIDSQLPVALEGVDIPVTGVVSSLPQQRDRFQRFLFAVDDASRAQTPGLPAQLSLSWYGQTELQAGQRWQLQVRLKRPRGSVNDGGFDYQRWLLSEGTGATGYVRDVPQNELLGVAEGFALLKRRQSLAQWIDRYAGPSGSALMIALAVGDSSRLTGDQWALLRTTGTIHLMAISGLHIGLVALFGFWLGHGLRVLASLWLTLGDGNRPWLNALPYLFPSLVSLMAAGGYASLAGFALPTQRALVMCAVVNLGIVLGRRVGAAVTLSWALLLVLLLDPLAGYDMGFWLSFTAVASLLLAFRGRVNPGVPERKWPWRLWGWVQGLGYAQWVVFVALLIPLLLLGQPVAWLSPLANLVAVPWVSLLVVLPLLCSICLSFFSESLAGAILPWIESSLAVCWHYLEWITGLADVGWAQAGTTPVPGPLAAGLALLGVLLLLLPRGFPARWLAPVLFLPCLLPPSPDRPPLVVSVLDVGQGLAVVVEAAGKDETRTLVYDTGPASSDRFNAGDAIVIPYLRARGITDLDMLVVSHSDNDHAGGALPVLRWFPGASLYLGEPLEIPYRQASTCHQGESLNWGEVKLEFLTSRKPSGGSNNNRSCVLLIRYRDWWILLPGDIESPVERRLLRDGGLPDSVDLLLAPHHGSNSSSMEAFVQHLSPDHVVFSAGYRSRYGHPHPKVQSRYREQGSVLYNTSLSGRLRFEFTPSAMRVNRLRSDRPRYWYWNP